jgi:hypothetical protein
MNRLQGVVLSMTLLCALVVVGGRSWLNTNGHVLYAFQGNLAGAPARRGQIQALAYMLQNRSSRTVTLRSISVHIPNHVHLVKVGAAPARTLDFFIFPRWPKSGLQSLRGFHIKPGEYTTIVLGVRADAPGVYLVMPVSIEADFPFAVGSVSVDVTNTEGRALCVDASPSTCAQAANADLLSVN